MALTPEEQKCWLKFFPVLFHEAVLHALYVTVKLGIPELLDQGPKSSQELADASKAQEPMLYRLLRMLTSFGLFHEKEGKIFEHNVASSILSRNHSFSLHSPILYEEEIVHKSWNHLLENVVTGKAAFEIAYGKSFFEYFKENPEKFALFNETMKARNGVRQQSALQNYNFGKFSSIYDIGGGYGHFIIDILNQYPHMKGLLFDVPEIINNIPELQPDLIHKRCTLKGGDFFIEVPTGGDAYLLSSILHDWPDMEAIKILNKCHEAMSSDSRLLIFERLLQGLNAPDTHNKLYDMLMMIFFAAQERTLEEYEKLLNASGFKVDSVHDTGAEFYIIEAKKI